MNTFKILNKPTSDELQDEVNAHLAEGWQLAGQLAIMSSHAMAAPLLLQPMTKADPVPVAATEPQPLAVAEQVVETAPIAPEKPKAPPEYALVSEFKAREVEREVTKLLEQGWELFGAPFSRPPNHNSDAPSVSTLCQGLVRYQR